MEAKMEDFTIPKKEEQSEIVLTEEEKTNFINCVLYEKPFKKTYNFLDGKLSVLLRTRTREELETIMSKTLEANPKTEMQYAELHVKYNLLYAVEEIVIEGKRETITGTFEERLEQIKKLKNPTKYFLFCKALENFDSLVQNFSNEMSKINF
jgi:hypothetical protein